jgi:hypothetical protein
MKTTFKLIFAYPPPTCLFLVAPHTDTHAKVRNVKNTCTHRRSVKVTHLGIFICFAFSCEAYSGNCQITAFGTSIWVPAKGKLAVYQYMDYTCIRINVSDLDADSVRSVDPDPDSGGQKLRKFMFWSAGCSLLRAEGFSCCMDVLYGGLGISKLQFSSFSCFWSSNPRSVLDPDPKPNLDRYSAENALKNPDPKHWSVFSWWKNQSLTLLCLAKVKSDLVCIEVQ